MFQTIVMIAVLGQASPIDSPQWSGAVTSVIGSPTVVRSGKSYRPKKGSGLKAGDNLLVNGSGGLAFYLRGNHVVYLGDGASATINGEPGRWRLYVNKGEARVTSSGKGLSLITKWATIPLRRSIVRVVADQQGARIKADHGQAVVRLNDGSTQLVPSGAMTKVGGAAQSKPFALKVISFQLASAIDARHRPEIPGNQRTGTGAGGGGKKKKAPPKTPKTGDAKQGASKKKKKKKRDAGKKKKDPPRPAVQPDRTPRSTQQDRQQEPKVTSTTNTGQTSSLTLGSISSSQLSFSSSGGLFSDANQQTLQGMLTAPAVGLSMDSPFPGNIHLITAENRYSFATVLLNAAEEASIFPSGNNAYWSIGVGTAPTSQVTTDFLTGTNPLPTTIAVPKFGVYLIRLDQYGIVDPGIDPAGAKASNVGLAGLLGSIPTAPSITGATPLLDTRGGADQMNTTATFALGELRLSKNTTGPGVSLDLAIRRSDQDRKIVKDPGGNDALDKVTANAQVSSYDDVADPRFLAQVPTVKVPTDGAFNLGPSRFSNLGFLRKAAVTTLVADQLFNYSLRTGQTRFVIRENGTRRIIDITGYRKP